jgi:hypothetical protein
MTSRKHWTVRRSRRRVAPYWEILNGRGVVFVCYGTEADAKCAAAAPQFHAYVKKQAKRGDAEAVALINELEGN